MDVRFWTEIDPVLGCDEQIYSNSCEAEKMATKL